MRGQIRNGDAECEAIAINESSPNILQESQSEPSFQADHSHAGLGAAAIRGGSWVLLAQAISTAIRAVSSLILARLLLPADFGLYAMAVAVLSGMLIFKDLGLCDAIIQSRNLTDRQLSSLFWVNLGIGAAIVACLMAVSPVFSWFYHDVRLAGIVAVWSLTILFGAVPAQHLAIMKRSMLFAGVSKLTIVSAATSNVGAIALAWCGAGYWALVLRDVINEVVNAVGAWVLCRWRPKKLSRHSGIRPMLIFGGHSVGAFIIRRASRNFDRTLLGWRFGPVITGNYHMAAELAAMLTSLLTEPLRGVAVASLSKLREQPTRFKQHYLKAALGASLVGFAATAVLVAAGSELVAVFLGPKWQDSAGLLRILGLSAGISAIYMTNIWLHFSLGRADRMARWILVETLVTAVSVALGLRFGAPGVAWGYSLAMLLLCITGLMYAGRPVGFGWGELIAPLWRPAVAAAAAAWLCWSVILRAPFVQAHILRLMLFCVSFCFVYACFVLILGGGLKTLRVIVRAHYSMTEPADGINAILTNLLGNGATRTDN